MFVQLRNMINLKMKLEVDLVNYVFSSKQKNLSSTSVQMKYVGIVICMNKTNCEEEY